MRVVDENGWTLVDHDPVTGKSTWSYFDGEKQHYRIDQPVDKMIDHNAEVRNAASTGWGGDWHRIASIPDNILWGEHGLGEAFRDGDDKFINKWLNDSDNRAWRTKEGRV